jgi:hypothetical protein
MPDPRELLTAYQDTLKGLRRGVGPMGVLVAPLQLTADLLDQMLLRQQALETQVDETFKQLEAVYELARDAPAALRTQAKAFTAAAAAFEQAAQVMNLQADLLERTGNALNVPARVLRRPRKPAARKPKA